MCDGNQSLSDGQLFLNLERSTLTLDIGIVQHSVSTLPIRVCPLVVSLRRSRFARGNDISCFPVRNGLENVCSWPVFSLLSTCFHEKDNQEFFNEIGNQIPVLKKSSSVFKQCILDQFVLLFYCFHILDTIKRGNFRALVISPFIESSVATFNHSIATVAKGNNSSPFRESFNEVRNYSSPVFIDTEDILQRCDARKAIFAMNEPTPVFATDFTLKFVEQNQSCESSRSAFPIHTENGIESIADIIAADNLSNAASDFYSNARMKQTASESSPHLNELELLNSKINLEVITHLGGDQNEYIARTFKRHNFASFDAGAKIIAYSKDMDGVSSVLYEDDDRYTMVPSSASDIWFIVQLSDEILIEAISISSIELYSSTVAHFQVWGTSQYPTALVPPDVLNEDFASIHLQNVHALDFAKSKGKTGNTNGWTLLGNFLAPSVRKPVMFNFSCGETLWSRYVFVRILSIQASSGQGELHYYFTLTSFKAFGRTVIQDAAAMDDYESKLGAAHLNHFFKSEKDLFSFYPPEVEKTTPSHFSLLLDETCPDKVPRNLSQLDNSSLFDFFPFDRQPSSVPLSSFFSLEPNIMSPAVDAHTDPARTDPEFKRMFDSVEHMFARMNGVVSNLKDSISAGFVEQRKAAASSRGGTFQRDFLEFIRVLHHREHSHSSGTPQLSILKRLSDRLKNLEIGVALSGRFLHDLNHKTEINQEFMESIASKMTALEDLVQMSRAILKSIIPDFIALRREEYNLIVYLYNRILSVEGEFLRFKNRFLDLFEELEKGSKTFFDATAEASMKSQFANLHSSLLFTQLLVFVLCCLLLIFCPWSLLNGKLAELFTASAAKIESESASQTPYHDYVKSVKSSDFLTPRFPSKKYSLRKGIISSPTPLMRKQFTLSPSRKRALLKPFGAKRKLPIDCNFFPSNNAIRIANEGMD